MKAKSLLSVVALCAAVTASAQGFKMGVEAGYDNILMKENEKDGDNDDASKTHLNGFHIGPTFNYQFGNDGGLGLNVGLFWQHGAGKCMDNWDSDYDYDDYVKETKEEYEASDFKDRFVYNAILLPVRVSYTHMFSDNFGIFGFAGPKLEFGINAKNKQVFKDVYRSDFDMNSDEDDDSKGKYVYTYDSFSGKYKEKFDGKKINDDEEDDDDDDEGDLKRVNIGLGLGAGVVMKNVYFSVSYDFGLLNREKSNYADDWKFRNSNLAVSVGVVF